MSVDEEARAAAEAGLSEAQIAVHWREEEYYAPPPGFAAQANAADPAIRERFSEEHFPECFTEYADLLTWDKRWDTILDTSKPPFWKWFVGGKLNACVNCVDRHLESRGSENALIWVPEPEEDEIVGVTYRELHRRVNEFAALLRDFCRREGGRPDHVPSADAARPAGVDAGVRPSGRDPLGGVRRVQRRRLRPADGRRAERDPRHDRRLLPQRRADRPQGEGGRGDRGRPQGGDRGREGARMAAPSGRVPLREPHGRGPRLLRRRAARGLSGAGGGARLDAGRGHVVPHVHERHDRPAEGRAALDRRVPLLRRRNLEVLPGHPSRRHVLVLRRHRLDHRPLLHRLRAAGAGHDQRDVRGRADVPGRGPAVADRGEAGREHLPHGADDDPDAAQAGPGRAGEVRLPLQDDDDGRRADRARRLALVLRHGRQGRGGDHRHVVADRDRRLPRLDPAGAREDEAGQLRPDRARPLRRGLRRERRGGPEGLRQGRQHLHAKPVAGPDADHLGTGRRGSSTPTTRSTAATARAPTGTTGRFCVATAPFRPQTATTGSSAASTT